MTVVTLEQHVELLQTGARLIAQQLEPDGEWSPLIAYTDGHGAAHIVDAKVPGVLLLLIPVSELGFGLYDQPGESPCKNTHGWRDDNMGTSGSLQRVNVVGARAKIPAATSTV